MKPSLHDHQPLIPSDDSQSSARRLTINFINPLKQPPHIILHPNIPRYTQCQRLLSLSLPIALRPGKGFLAEVGGLLELGLAPAGEDY